MRQLIDAVGSHPSGHFEIARPHLHDAATMAWAAHHLIADAERIHDVEGEQRDMRRLEHVAAGVEHEIRRLARCGGRGRFLAEPRQHLIVDLKLRQHRYVASEVAVFLQALAPPCRQIVTGFGSRDARHGEQKAWIDAFVAGRNAFAAERAGLRPCPRRVGPVAVAKDIDDAADDIRRHSIRKPCGLHARAGLDAFAAAGAGIDHLVDALLNGGFEGDVVERHVGLLGRRNGASLTPREKSSVNAQERKW